MSDGAAVLHPPVVPDAQDRAVIGDERRTDRHAALVAAASRLLDGVIQADPNRDSRR